MNALYIGLFVAMSTADVALGLRLTSAYPECPPGMQNLTESTGTIGSSLYPGYYPTEPVCEWLITSNEQFVQLQFVFFNTNQYDLVYVFDGYEAPDRYMLAALHYDLTRDQPGPYETSRSYMYIYFACESGRPGPGFEARYTFVSVKQQCPLEVQNLTGSTGIITSPLYPDPYLPSAYCQWRISSTEQYVKVEFLDFTLRTTDFVYIRDGYNITSPLIIRLSGTSGSTAPGPYTTTQSYMHMQFTSDMIYSSSPVGFEARYTSISDFDQHNMRLDHDG